LRNDGIRTALRIELSSEQRTALERLARQRSAPARVVERARIVLLAAEGLENKQIAGRMGVTPEKAARWRKRFLAGGIAALEKDAPRPGRTRTVTESPSGTCGTPRSRSCSRLRAITVVPPMHCVCPWDPGARTAALISRSLI